MSDATEPKKPRFPADAMSLTAEMHEDYAVQKVVPEWATPWNVTVAQSVLSLLAGALVGAGLTDQFGGVSDRVVRAAVNECVRTSEACADLTIKNSHPTLLIAGLLLAAVYGLLLLKRRRKPAPLSAPPSSASQV